MRVSRQRHLFILKHGVVLPTCGGTRHHLNFALLHSPTNRPRQVLRIGRQASQQSVQTERGIGAPAPMYVCMCTDVYIYIYTYVYKEKEKERERERDRERERGERERETERERERERGERGRERERLYVLWR